MSDVKPMFNIKINNPLTIEEQLKERAHNGKCVMGWWDADGNFVSFWANVNYYEKLFIVDSLQRRMTWEINQNNDQGEE